MKYLLILALAGCATSTVHDGLYEDDSDGGVAVTQQLLPAQQSMGYPLPVRCSTRTYHTLDVTTNLLGSDNTWQSRYMTHPYTKVNMQFFKSTQSNKPHQAIDILSPSATYCVLITFRIKDHCQYHTGGWMQYPATTYATRWWAPADGNHMTALPKACPPGHTWIGASMDSIVYGAVEVQ